MNVLVATVTTTSPLTVTVQGDDDPMPVARTWGAISLTVGDEVRAAIIDGQVELLAKVVDA